MGGVKSYGQYCALARGLDVIGERWTLLIVRELLDGPRRYNELLAGLPGIATNLLADRLRQLEESGVVDRGAGGQYRLTAWGEKLREPLYALARWSAPVVMRQPLGDDNFRGEWLVHPVRVLYDGIDPRRPPMTVEVRVGDTPITIESVGGEVRVHHGPARSPDVVLTGPPDLVLGLLTGSLDPDAARRMGLEITGDARRLRRLRPRAARTPADPRSARAR